MALAAARWMVVRFYRSCVLAMSVDQVLVFYRASFNHCTGLALLACLCDSDTLEFAEAARMLSKSGSTQFPGEGNAIAYAVQDSESAPNLGQIMLCESRTLH